MDHQEWTESRAAERYLLREMAPEERDAFEQHLFECTECGEDVGAGVTFIEGIKAAEAADRAAAARTGRRSRMMAWTSSVAASLLLLFAGYQNLVQIPRLRPTFSAVPPTQELTAPTRGAEDDAITELPAGADRILVPIVSEPPAPRYEVQLRDSAGKVLGTTTITAEQAANPVEFRLPPLPAGSYAVVARGVREDGSRADAGVYRFRVRE